MMWTIRYMVVTGVLLVVTLMTMLSLVCFPDHTPNAPPPGLTEQTIIYVLSVLLFPMVFMVTHNPIEFEPLLWTLVFTGFVLSAMLWALPIILFAKLVTKNKAGRAEHPNRHVFSKAADGF